jgi:YidC/Oxa1 family membrane protein insertase
MNNTLRYVLFALAGAVLVYYVALRKPDRPNAGRLAQENPPAATTNRAAERTFRVLTPSSGNVGALEAVLTSHSAAVRDLWMTGGQFRHANAPVDPRTEQPTQDRRLNLSTTYREELLPLRVQLRLRRGETSVMPDYADFEGQQVNEHEVAFTWRGNDVEVVRTYRGERPFVMRVETRVTNRGAPVTVEHALPLYHWATRTEEAGKFFQRPWQLSEAMCHHGGELYREGRDNLLERRGDALFPGNARFVGVGNLYFVSALVPQGNAEVRCRLFAEDRPNSESAVGSVYAGALAWPRATLEQGGTETFAASAFFGPKDEAVLTRAIDDGRLKDTVNLGFFSFIARQLVRFLRFLHGITGNWGTAIILLTLCIRVALLPLLAKSMKSMAMMQKLKPELDEINKKFADNAEAKTLATMELYRKHGMSTPSRAASRSSRSSPSGGRSTPRSRPRSSSSTRPSTAGSTTSRRPTPSTSCPSSWAASCSCSRSSCPPRAWTRCRPKMMTYFFPIFLTGSRCSSPRGSRCTCSSTACSASPAVVHEEADGQDVGPKAQAPAGVVKAIVVTAPRREAPVSNARSPPP